MLTHSVYFDILDHHNIFNNPTTLYGGTLIATSRHPRYKIIPSVRHSRYVISDFAFVAVAIGCILLYI